MTWAQLFLFQYLQHDYKWRWHSMKEALGMPEDKEAMVHLGDAYQHYIS